MIVGSGFAGDGSTAITRPQELTYGIILDGVLHPSSFSIMPNPVKFKYP